MFLLPTRTRYSEYDENSRIRLSALLNYLQDTSTLHSHDCGMTVDHYRSLHQAWLITYWDILIEALPPDCAHITLGTSPHSMKGIFTHRDFWIEDTETGKPYVKADSIWFLVNTDTMLPEKLDESHLEPFGELKKVLDHGAGTRKVKIGDPADFTAIADFTVPFEMLDTNHHVNNIQYLSAAYDALVSSGTVDRSYYPSRIRAEYRQAAKLGDRMLISVHEEEGKYLFLLSSGSGTDYCHIEFS